MEESFRKLESMNCEMSDLKELVALILEDCFAFICSSLKEYEVREKYTTAQTMINAIFRLLDYSIEDTNRFINETYERMKTQKEGASNVCN